MRKSLTIASTLALALGAASAQTNTTTTTTTTTPTQVVTFTDVPAGHWAKDAVDLLVQRGLIQGYPDGTFRGNQNITRYEAALIFFRLLQSGSLSNSTLSQSDLATITAGMQEVATELAAISTRVTDLERLNAEQQARIAALEERINALGTAGTAGADTAALTARIDALETAIRNIPAGPQGPAGPAGPAGAAADTAALEARIAALEARATQTGTTTGGTTTIVTPPTTVVIGETPTGTTNGVTRGDLYAGVYVGASSAGANNPCYIPNSDGRAVNYCASFGGMVGTTSLVGPFGARVSADYKPGRNALSADVNATIGLNTGTNIQPYAGVGLGLTSSTGRTTATANTNVTDTYVNALVGVDFQVTNSIAAFVEGNGRYYLSSKGAGSVQNTNTATDQRGFVPAVRAGLKFYF
ncbi:S-layer homology domain-containing protein [Deinococcus sp. NW-56]|uniref:S-layer homology domain-containing protein n=1 Tax=Deinococcus sp. NW-56 TaxID=2080419 RepID=UPI000CF51F1C|nr:S-layer homology domain-containing protein [Deinococcus sp. NW-56]